MNRIGFYHGENVTLSYEISQMPARSQYTEGDLQPSETPGVLTALVVKDFHVWPNGADNLEPNTCDALISGNRLLPSLIEKQTTILYGHGPRLYTEEITDDGKIIRHYLHNERIEAWLDAWKENGLPDSFDEYINKCIRSFYYSEGIFTKWHLSRGHRAGVRGALPVSGLEHVSELRCRLATKNSLSSRTDVEDRDFQYVIVANWAAFNVVGEAKAYPRMNFSDPLARNSVISYSKNPNHGNDIYATNVFFQGLKEWIRGCNATPEYINSFLENALSARHHVIIPQAWIEQKEEALQAMCDKNAELQAAHKPMVDIKVGRRTLEVGSVYTPELLEKYINLELQKMTEWLSGRGRNQGKIYATRSFINGQGDEEKWTINEIDQKYKEYISALIDYDKRADEVLLSGKGIDSSISNITVAGTISKSGSDAYYNYVIYLTQQALPERIICKDINYALKLNFPEEYRRGVRLGFYRPNVQRQEDISPKNRLSNQEEL